jgi:hypothetical protein
LIGIFSHNSYSEFKGIFSNLFCFVFFAFCWWVLTLTFEVWNEVCGYKGKMILFLKYWLSLSHLMILLIACLQRKDEIEGIIFGVFVTNSN